MKCIYTVDLKQLWKCKQSFFFVQLNSPQMADKKMFQTIFPVLFLENVCRFFFSQTI